MNTPEENEVLTDESVTLLPCPHCGGSEGVYPGYKWPGGGPCIDIDCIECGYDFKPREGLDVIAMWNRRAALSHPVAAEGEVAGLVDPMPWDEIEPGRAIARWVIQDHEASGLHPRTARMVRSFAGALGHKLRAAEMKYGHADEWASKDWEERCQADLMDHVLKGDPLDVAAYAAFCWSNKWRTAPEPSTCGTEAEGRSKPIPSATQERTATHFRDPCIYCRTPHDEVQPGPCPSSGVTISRERAEALLTYTKNGRGPAGWPVALWVEVQHFIEEVTRFLEHREES